MSVLDDPDALRAADPSGMLDSVGASADDCETGYTAGLAAGGLPVTGDLTGVTFLGMGGSAVAGDLTRALFRQRLGVPLDVVRSPELPEHCETRSLVVATSYSGDTAETLAAFEEAVERGCRIVAVTSGGRLARRAAEEGIPVVSIPGGMQPRAALGHLAFTTLGALEAAGVLPRLGGEVRETVGLLRALAAELGPEKQGNRAMRLAERIGDRYAVIWGTEGIGSVAAMRWKTQINENAKRPAWWASMSELDHNEIVGWVDGAGADHFLVTLRHDGEAPSIAPRFPLSVDLVAASGLHHEEVQAVGDSALARACSLILMGDFVSVYLGLLRRVDPTPVEVIDRLKKALG
ncbi:MAG: bifunctional phosphoglucose/phosphomannose isomerase [Actinomycetota bacterium]